jgi:hypothetical protein
MLHAFLDVYEFILLYLLTTARLLKHLCHLYFGGRFWGRLQVPSGPFQGQNVSSKFKQVSLFSLCAAVAMIGKFLASRNIVSKLKPLILVRQVF